MQPALKTTILTPLRHRGSGRILLSGAGFSRSVPAVGCIVSPIANQKKAVRGLEPLAAFVSHTVSCPLSTGWN